MIDKTQSIRQTAIVTGGGVRIGRGIALALADAGWDVVVHYSSSRAPAADTVEEIERKGRKALAVQADFQQPVEAADRLFQAAARQFGSVSLLVNSAAIFEPGNVMNTAEEHWDRHFAINLKAPFFLCQQFAAQFPKDDLIGQIINIVDWRGETPPGTHTAYTLTKAGLIALTKSLALELAPAIRVNAIAPGAILPPPGQTQDTLEAMKSEIPLDRTGNVNEITRAVLYLTQAEFVTGEILHVTGGQQL